MRRRDLITGTVAMSAVATSAVAGGEGGSTPSAAALNISGVGLPVIVGGRIRNYVFVALRLHLGAGHTPESIRPKEAYFRDSLVRAAHRTPFVVAGDWTRVDAALLSASLIRSANTIAGRGTVSRVEVISQVPRRRVVARAS